MKLATSPEVVVADAGPLIALARLALLGAPKALFSRALLTTTVLAECEARPDRDEGRAIRAAIDFGQYELVAALEVDHSWGIDAGEASAIALALEVNGRVLIDDKAGRSVAAHLGRPVIGTVGLLVVAKRRGVVTSVRPHLEALLASGYFIGEQVVAEALRLAGE